MAEHLNCPSGDSRPAAARWAAFLLGALAMGLVVSGQSLLPSTDSYYHLRMARLLPSLGFPHEFPWLQWTIFRDGFVSHHYGFHVLLAPFAWLSERLTGDLVAGGKAAAVLSMGATTALFFLVLRALRVPGPLFWTALFGCLPWHFWLRLGYVRAPLAALPLLLLTVLWMLRGRVFGLALVACAFVTIYLGAVVALLVPFCLLAGHVLAGTGTRRMAGQGLAFIAGFGLGIVASPYFPDNLPFLRIQMFVAGLGAVQDAPSEWRPYDAWKFATMCAPLAAIWLSALVYRLRRRRALDGNGLGLLLLNLALLALTLKSRRFIEYWPVFALLNAAEMARVEWAQVAGVFVSDARRVRAVAASAVLLAMVLSLPGLLYARRHVRPPPRHAAIRAASLWLARNTPAHALVLTDDWDVFPSCFYYNTHNFYAVGLDPAFTRIRYPELWQKYRQITRAGEGLAAIAADFHADYVLVQEESSVLFDRLRARPGEFELVWPSPAELRPAAAVFKVKRLATGS